jgi:hypothetical protein
MNLFKELAMHISTKNKDYIIKSIENLPPQKVQEVIDFIDFLLMRSQDEASGVDVPSLLLQQDVLSKIWEDEKDLYEL